MARPRTVSLAPEEMVKLGEEMIKFVSDPKNKVLHLSEWYTIEKGYTYNEWKTMHVAPEFFPYYEQALKKIAKKYLDGTVNPSIAQRWLRTYFGDLKENEDADMKAKAEIDKESKKEEASNALEGMAKVLDQVARTREELSLRKSTE